MSLRDTFGLSLGRTTSVYGDTDTQCKKETISGGETDSNGQLSHFYRTGTSATEGTGMYEMDKWDKRDS